jgi:hypothetical protein
VILIHCFIINEIAAIAIGKEIIASSGNFYPKYATCCSAEKSEFCDRVCERVCGYVAAICGLIPNGYLRTAVIIASDNCNG